MELHMVFFKGITDGIKRIIFFCVPFLLVNPSVIIFFNYQRTSRQTKKITDIAFSSVILLVN